ncbi:MAG: hypothetical protein JAY90_07250 [Candidatus Thiodiazotropha lotti]|nr:hypothetical protein [Candidatus Thiodiazotropha lotti]ODB94870.1 hypothetical protein A3197_19240 [Candidatus Thiodiazotropha endoloripes]
MKNRTYTFDRLSGTGGSQKPFVLSEDCKKHIHDRLIKKVEIEKIDGFLLFAEISCEEHINITEVEKDLPDWSRFRDEIKDASELANQLSVHLSNWHYQSEDLVIQQYYRDRKLIEGNHIELLARELGYLAKASKQAYSYATRTPHRHSDPVVRLAIDIIDVFEHWLCPPYTLSTGSNSKLPEIIGILLTEVKSTQGARNVVKSALKIRHNKKVK